MTTGTVTRALSLRGAARAVLECRDPEVLICGAAGTGKSFAVLWKAHLMCLQNPGMKALFVRKTHVSLTATGLATFKTHVAAEALAAGFVVWFGGSGAEPPGFKYSNGSTISVGGMDNPTKIMSSEYDFIYVQEATELTPDDWEKCTTRLRNGVVSFQQLAADCNPEGPDHWLKKRCDEGQTTMLYALHTDNPRLFNDDGQPTEKGAAYLDTLSKLSGVRRHRLYGGIWAAAEGIIYEGWNPAVHITERKILPKDWMRIWSIDFGYTNPFVWQMWAIDPDGRLILEKEIYRSQRIVADHAQQILDVVTHTHHRVLTPAGGIDPNLSRWIYPRPIRILCDHDAEDRATLEREIGMPTSPATKTVSDGLQACMQRLEIQPDGLPRLQVCRTALVDRDEALADRGLPLGFIGEVPGYVWEPAPDGKPNKDRPLKLNDHSCFASGTPVLTAAGQVPIERVGAGAHVWTRAGWRRVLAAGMTQRNASVVTVLLSNGAHLTATGDHPVWVEGRGWIRSDALRYADRLQAWEEWTLSDTPGSSTGVTPMPRHKLSAGTTSPVSPIGSAARSAYMKRSGWPNTDRSRTIMRSIMSILIHSTMTSRIFDACRSLIIGRCIPSIVGRPVPIAPLTDLHCLPASSHSPSSGMPAPRGESGIGNTVRRPGRDASIATPPVISAVLDTGHAISARSVSVPMPASRRGAGHLASTMLIEPAFSAVTPSASTGTPRRVPVPVRVLSVIEQGERADVWNLTIEGEHEFVASGVLVHNCDAWRYAVADLDVRPKVGVRWL